MWGLAAGLFVAMTSVAEAQTYTKRRWKKSEPRPQMVEETSPEGALVLTLARMPFPMPAQPEQTASMPAEEPDEAPVVNAKPAQPEAADKPAAKPAAATSTKKTSSKAASKTAGKSSSKKTPAASRSSGTKSKTTGATSKSKSK